jgi:two-component system sensor histidine kinase/response regulator
MNDHISKPIDPVALFETLARYLKPTAGAAPPIAAVPLAAAVDTGPELPETAGLDTQDGLARVAGNRKLYGDLLRQFIEQQGPAVGQISAALAQGDAALAGRLAHTLDGVAGNLGAKSLRAAAGALEKLIRERASAAEVDSAKNAMAAELDPLVAGLRGSLCPPITTTPLAPSPPLPAADLAPALAAAAQLAKLLSEHDPGAVECLEANQAALGSLFSGGTWPPFQKLVRGYGFTEARSHLNHALESLPSP